MSASDKTFTSDFRRFFVRGLTILLPSVLTLWILWQAFAFVYRNVAEPINRGIRVGVVWVIPNVVPQDRLPPWYRVEDRVIEARIEAFKQSDEFQLLKREPRPQQIRNEVRRDRLQVFWDDRWYLNGTGLLVAIVLIYLAGVLLGGYVGRRIYSRLERLISRVPGFKQVYPHVKQLVDLIMGDRPTSFKRAVLVQYPRKGIWTVGLLTGSSMKDIHSAADSECVSIFIPSTPTPFTGFTITVPKADIVDLPITIDEAIRFFITGGALVPEKQLPPGVTPPVLGGASVEPPAGDPPRPAPPPGQPPPRGSGAE